MSLYWKALPLKIVLFIALYPVVGPWAFLLAPLAIVSLLLIMSHSSTEGTKRKADRKAEFEADRLAGWTQDEIENRL